MIRLRKYIRNNRGQSMVEFALVLPLLLLILGGLIDFGRVFNQSMIVTAAAREGARAAAVGESASVAANAAAAAKAYAAAIDQGGLQVSVNPTAPASGDRMTVTVTNPVTIYFPGMAVFFPSNPYTVRGVATMRKE